MKNINIRYTAPTRYDKAEYGTLCKVLNDNDTYSIYIQTSQDIEHASWIKTSDIIEKAFDKFLQVPEFIFCCMEITNSKPQDQPALFKELIDLIIAYIPNKK